MVSSKILDLYLLAMLNKSCNKLMLKKVHLHSVNFLFSIKA